MSTWYPYTIFYRWSIVTESVSPAACEILNPKHIGVTTHVKSLITWRFVSHMLFPIGALLKPSPYLQAFKSYSAPNIPGSRPWPLEVTWRNRACDYLIPPYSISYRCSTVTDSICSRFGDIGPWKYWGHDLDLSRSRDVIDHVTIRFPIWGFLLVLHWNRAPISKRYQVIRLEIYLGHNLDLFGSRDVIEHVTIW